MADDMDICQKLGLWAHDAALQDAREHCRGLNDAAREIERLRELVRIYEGVMRNAKRDLDSLRKQIEDTEARRG